MIINNELDMFNVLVSKAESKKIDTEHRDEFFEGIKHLQRVLSFVKMKEVPGGLVFERGFDTVKVCVRELGAGLVSLTYEKNEWFKNKEQAIRKAQEEAIREYSLW